MDARRVLPFVFSDPAVHERTPVWSPDGKSIAYFSDASGEYELHVRDQEGKGEAKAYKLPGAGFYGSPVWAPDSQKLSFADNSLTLFWIDLKTGAVKKIASDYFYGPGRVAQMHSSWSQDLPRDRRAERRDRTGLRRER